MRRFVLIPATCLFLLCGTAAAASFDCARAASRLEKLICANPELSAQDETLNAAYRNALGRAADKAMLRRAQRNWLYSLDAGCADSLCVQDAFSERIRLLGSLAGSNVPGTNWTGHFVRYWKGREDTDSASITVLPLENGHLHLTGEALWLGPDGYEGQVATGQMTGYATVQPDGTALFESEYCKARLRLRDDALEVSGESGCGGIRVTFNGDYRRQ
ncbi:lysozyme inhibitor LprI family protein [Pseudoduganella sp. SL102]|uniref:lysozyme inhibitor LprI family protein n=1 Tax=Pseudoduganella sp. SL102 TaxID=2995154 RepID=UPI00248AF913|nr:lysozyme inhibitor LprI family protein [Pseudoduganella sp. SL102]WBS03025.1 lysozyme inhibitor LprI family protein [Pseudoduganella sp. SL102]